MFIYVAICNWHLQMALKNKFLWSSYHFSNINTFFTFWPILFTLKCKLWPFLISAHFPRIPLLTNLLKINDHLVSKGSDLELPQSCKIRNFSKPWSHIFANRFRNFTPIFKNSLAPLIYFIIITNHLLIFIYLFYLFFRISQWPFHIQLMWPTRVILAFLLEFCYVGRGPFINWYTRSSWPFCPCIFC